MIGVVARNDKHAAVREFFELFKTPWEFCRPGIAYDVLICSAGAEPPDNEAGLVFVYGCAHTATDSELGIATTERTKNAILCSGHDRIPIYGSCLTLVGPGDPILQTEEGEVIALDFVPTGSGVIRIGFDLFAEVELLLGQGQAQRHARTPTLDLHVSFLRHLIVGHGISLIEIPPVPAGYEFIVCLTHDVDHYGIRNHRLDHTMFGFLYRGTFGSFIDLCAGRKTLRQLAANWKAAFSLPLVYLGLATDFWKTLRRYRAIEGSFPSTFFVLPKSGDPGLARGGRAPSRRAAKYDLAQIKDEIHDVVSDGCEIGLHGIDAWNDATKGRSELRQIQSLTGQVEVGVRMHWLYFDQDSPRLLEEAGFSYDSSNGYNETVGYRAGTTQVFTPPGRNHLLELPMHVMDTALFYPEHLNLKPRQAKAILDGMLANCARFGGVLTVNWHDRSIAPERLWDETYRELLDELRGKKVWFATASQVVSWFRKRRSARFEITNERIISIVMDPSADDSPGLEMRRHNASLKPLASPSAESSAPITSLFHTSEPRSAAAGARLQSFRVTTT